MRAMVPLTSNYHSMGPDLLRRRSGRSGSSPPPALISALQFAEIDVSLAKSSTKHQQHFLFTLTLRPSATPLLISPCWTTLRSMDECRSYKKRLLTIMQLGHFCEAECPWLYSFVKSYFPKKRMFSVSSSSHTNARRDALELCVRRIQASLLRRSNHSCSVFTEDFARLFIEFVFGDNAQRESFLEGAATADSNSNSKRRSTICSTPSSDEEDDESPTEEMANCTLCDCHLSQGAGSVCSSRPETIAPSSYYTTTLRCGHEFHDECILPVLNDTMRCPTCGQHELE